MMIFELPNNLFRNQTLEDEFKVANIAKLYAYTIRRSTRGHAAVREDGQVFIRYKYYYKGYKWSAWEKTAALPERITEELDPTTVRLPTVKYEMELAARIEKNRIEDEANKVATEIAAKEFWFTLMKEFELLLSDDCEACRAVKADPANLNIHHFQARTSPRFPPQATGKLTCKTIKAMCRRAQELRKQNFNLGFAFDEALKRPQNVALVAS
jgi:hypothetical protein